MTELHARLQAALAGRYTINRELGRGGMAVVFLGNDVKHNRQVAIKVLRPELAATLGAERFLREIQIAAKLNHPHIVPLFDSGEADGLLYYVMPFVGGKSLRVRLATEGTIPMEEALAIAHAVALALSHAHERGVIHRDIKPENILLSGREPVVTDFGIARAISAAGGKALTMEGLVVGTLGYMSPEQAAGSSDLDARSDIYGLGCVLYEMLVGRAPGRWIEVHSGNTGRIPKAPKEDRLELDRLPRGVERVLVKALAKQPDRRFAAAQDFADALANRDAPLEGPFRRTIAVLPFANMSADPENEYFSDGITEEITNALTKIRSMRVASRTSAFVYRGSKLDVREVGARLAVEHVLEGSVRREGGRIRLTAQLVNVEDGCHLWSERYDRELRDVFAIQDELAQSIVQALRLAMSDEEREAIARVPTEHVQAYDYYLRGRQFFHQFRRRSLSYARQMFERAIEIDPEYALAYTGIADCCSTLYMNWGSHPENLEGAETAVHRALELDPDLAEARAAHGLVLAQRGRHDEAQREFEAAIRLDPKLYEARYFYARTCFQQGKMEMAAQLFEKAAEVQEDYQARFFAAQSYAALGRVPEAEASYRRALVVVKDHLELNPDDARAVTMGAVAQCRIGQKEAGLEWAERAVMVDPEDASIAYNVACLYALEGESDKAIESLERAVSRGFGNRNWLERDPDLESLRDDPRFIELIDGIRTNP